MTKKILLTGAAGFLGQHLYRMLVRRGEEVIPVCRTARGLPNELVWDLSEEDATRKVRDSGALDGVTHLFHLAAQMPRPEQPPLNLYHHGTIATANLVRALPDTITWLGFAGSIDVYGIPNRLPIDETTSTFPFTHYANAKLAAENLLHIEARDRNLKLAILRITQVYGPGDRTRKLIPQAMKRMVRGLPPIIHGHGEAARDYLHVADAAIAFLKALDREYQGTVNITSGASHTVNQVIQILIQVTGLSVEPLRTPSPKKDYGLTFAVDKARELGFQPSFDLSEGLGETWSSLSRKVY